MRRRENSYQRVGLLPFQADLSPRLFGPVIITGEISLTVPLPMQISRLPVRGVQRLLKPTITEWGLSPVPCMGVPTKSRASSSHRYRAPSIKSLLILPPNITLPGKQN